MILSCDWLRPVCLVTALVATLVNPTSLPAQQVTPYQPARGQAGKDVVWIPTPDALVSRMLKLGQVTERDQLVDLGSGDGRIVIAAAKEAGARALGLEFDPKLVAHATRKAEEAGVAGRAEFRQADIFAADFSHADVVTLYLLPDLNLKLRPTLLAMKPGTRVVSHQFTMGNWEPDEVSWVENRPAYLWLIPANAGGTWQATYPGDQGSVPARLSLEQVFQKAKGSVEFGAVRTGLRGLQLEGARIAFGFTDGDGALRRVQAVVTGDRMEGTVSGPAGPGEFKAQRTGTAPAIGGSTPPSTDELNSALKLLGE